MKKRKRWIFKTLIFLNPLVKNKETLESLISRWPNLRPTIVHYGLTCPTFPMLVIKNEKVKTIPDPSANPSVLQTSLANLFPFSPRIASFPLPEHVVPKSPKFPGKYWGAKKTRPLLPYWRRSWNWSIWKFPTAIPNKKFSLIFRFFFTFSIKLIQKLWQILIRTRQARGYLRNWPWIMTSDSDTSRTSMP